MNSNLQAGSFHKHWFELFKRLYSCNREVRALRAVKV
jgi:hypothetical protein